MNKKILTMLILGAVLTTSALVAVAGDHPKSEHPKKEAAPTVAEKMAGLQAMCTETAEARTARQEAEPLFNRLGGYDKVLEFMKLVIQYHEENEEIKHLMYDVDTEVLAKHLADFVSAGTGGTAKYTGRDLPSSHAHLKLTDADFLAAGGDIMKAMKSMEYGEEETQEFICILVSLKDQVVFK